MEMDVATLADLLHETAEHHGAFEAHAPKHDWWDWYAPYLDPRQHGSTPEAAARRGRSLHGRGSPHRPALTSRHARGAIRHDGQMPEPRNIAPATGKLGVLLPGLGAVASTFIAGVLTAAAAGERADRLGHADGAHPPRQPRRGSQPADPRLRAARQRSTTSCSAAGTRSRPTRSRPRAPPACSRSATSRRSRRARRHRRDGRRVRPRVGQEARRGPREARAPRRWTWPRR